VEEIFIFIATVTGSNKQKYDRFTKSNDKRNGSKEKLLFQDTIELNRRRTKQFVEDSDQSCKAHMYHEQPKYIMRLVLE